MTERMNLHQAVARFQAPTLGESLWQTATSFGGFFASCAAMYAFVDEYYWITLAIGPLAAGFLVRIFIIQHDCGHFAFFRGRRANNALGFACSLLTLAPYSSWRRQHAGHHGVWNDLDRRQSGADIYSSCLTVAEYRALSPMQRRWHRMTRHPLFANVLLPPLIFIVLYRTPFDMPKSWRRERRNVHLTTLALVAVLVSLGLLVGYERVAGVQLPVIAIASIIGVWLFSVQHRGEMVRWARHDAWDSTSAALQSATYLRLPAVLRWFTGNIGYHHVHHLNPRVPNYRLQECHESIPALREVPTLAPRDWLCTLRFVLWDEERGRMVTFREADAEAAGTDGVARHLLNSSRAASSTRSISRHFTYLSPHFPDRCCSHHSLKHDNFASTMG